MGISENPVGLEFNPVAAELRRQLEPQMGTSQPSVPRVIFIVRLRHLARGKFAATLSE